MATTVGEAIDEKVSVLEAEIAELRETRQCAPAALLGLEGDSVEVWTAHSFRFTDQSHPGLCVKLMETCSILVGSGRKRMTRVGAESSFYLKTDGDSYIFVDVVRPSKNCKEVKVRVTEERVIELCGDLPSNYELIEVLAG